MNNWQEDKDIQACIWACRNLQWEMSQMNDFFSDEYGSSNRFLDDVGDIKSENFERTKAILGYDETTPPEKLKDALFGSYAAALQETADKLGLTETYGISLEFTPSVKNPEIWITMTKGNEEQDLAVDYMRRGKDDKPFIDMFYKSAAIGIANNVRDKIVDEPEIFPDKLYAKRVETALKTGKLDTGSALDLYRMPDPYNEFTRRHAAHILPELGIVQNPQQVEYAKAKAETIIQAAKEAIVKYCDIPEGFQPDCDIEKSVQKRLETLDVKEDMTETKTKAYLNVMADFVNYSALNGDYGICIDYSKDDFNEKRDMYDVVLRREVLSPELTDDGWYAAESNGLCLGFDCDFDADMGYTIHPEDRENLMYDTEYVITESIGWQVVLEYFSDKKGGQMGIEPDYYIGKNFTEQFAENGKIDIPKSEILHYLKTGEMQGKLLDSIENAEQLQDKLHKINKEQRE